ncbi:MAG: hypothetical protein GXP63_00340 [DPANN group archaeon]|nr:hypothetical protein [DPANN group archaeon]
MIPAYGHVAVICSTRDSASSNMLRAMIRSGELVEGTELFDGHPIHHLQGQGEKIRVYTTDRQLIALDDLDGEIDADFFIFASRHQSRSGIPSLTCHIPGNWGKNEMGGKEKQLCVASPLILKHCLKNMVADKGVEKQGNLDAYEIVQEVTHHGPHIRKPIMFMEIGSDEARWQDDDAGNFMAAQILRLAQDILEQRVPSAVAAVGIGGTHTASNFFDIMTRGSYAVGHICPKYALTDMNLEMCIQALESNDCPCRMLLVDWKGLGDQKQRIRIILAELEKQGYAWETTSEAKKRVSESAAKEEHQQKRT